MTALTQREAPGSAPIPGQPYPLTLPFDKEAPPVSSYVRDTESIVIEASLRLGLDELAAKAGASRHVILLAAFNALMHRYSGQDDIVVCTSIERNDRNGGRDPFPLRTSLADGASAIELIEQIAAKLKDAAEHRASAADSMAESASSLPPGAEMRPFNTAFLFPDPETPDQPGRPSDAFQGIFAHDLAECALVFCAHENDDALTVQCEYDAELFETETITRLLGHFRNLLSGLISSPTAPLSGLPFLTPEERRQILEGWNDTRVEYRQNDCVHGCFEAQANRTPDSVALVFGEECLSYAELNARANRLARHLRELGVGPDVVVGIYVERSMEMVIGLLGILKAGGAYLPLDPTYPRERLAFMLEDAQVPVLLTQGRLIPSLPEHRANVVCLDGDWPTLAGEDAVNSPSGVGPHNLAYLIYTSGSTGRPKGVMVEHHNVMNFFTGMDQCLGPDLRGTWLAVTSLSFDISVLEIFWTLARGFKVVIAREDDWREEAPRGGGQSTTTPIESAKDAAPDGFSAIPALIGRHEVTHFQCTPSMARILILDEGARRAFGALKHLLIGGEALPASLAAALRAVAQGNVINMYGPTETTIWSTTCRLNGTSGRIAIGRPIANTEAYILDRNFQPVPVGAPGELMIGGAGVVRGYLNRPDLTAERFVRNPFSRDPLARLYRTGDLARFLPSADIEFIGRLDNQVKVRGHRIELGEIEALLNTYPDISQSVVVAREDVPGDKRLVGYIVYRNGRMPGTVQLRDFVRERLPEYMIPAHFVTLEAFPLTPNNKIDRNALPAPEHSASAQEASYEAPASAIEKALAELWAETLRVQRVGRNDNFFDLGGDSLSAIQITFNIRDACHVGVPAAALFSVPTVAAQAKHLEEAFAVQAASADARDVMAIAPETYLKGPLPDYEAPRTPEEQAIARIWADMLGAKRIGRKDSFFDLGGSSLQAMNLFMRIEEQFGKKLPLATLFQADTLEQLALVVQGKALDTASWSSLVPIQKNGAKPPFFCVHAAGGNVLLYRNLAMHLGDHRPFYGLQCPGLDGEQNYLTRIEDMAHHYLQEIRSVQPEGPYYLGGFCMGGLIAFEMAQQLRRDGQVTAVVAMIDTFNPALISGPQSIRDRISYNMQKLRFHWLNVVTLGPHERIEYLRAKTRGAGIREFSRLSTCLPGFSTLLALINREAKPTVFLEDFNEEVSAKYKPQPYEGLVALARPRKHYSFFSDPRMGWDNEICSRLNIIELPVYPGGLFVEPYVRVTADKLRECLDQPVRAGATLSCLPTGVLQS